MNQDTFLNNQGFPIKDMTLCELFCQAGIASDAEVMRATEMARNTGCSVGYAISLICGIKNSVLFGARRIVNKFLRNPGDIEETISAIRNLALASHNNRPSERISSRVLRLSTSKQIVSAREALPLKQSSGY